MVSRISSTLLSLAAFGTLALAQTPANAWQSNSGYVQQKPKLGCYKKVSAPPQYRTVYEKQLVRRASKTYEIIPAQYAWKTKRVRVQNRRVSWQVTPAIYEKRAQRVLVSRGQSIARTLPAVYGTVRQKVIVKSASTGWEMRKIRGEWVQCKVQLPAVWGTVSKQVVVRPAKTWYEKTAPIYETRWVNVQVRAARKQKVVQPAIYQTVEKKVRVRKARKVWRKIPAE